MAGYSFVTKYEKGPFLILGTTLMVQRLKICLVVLYCGIGWPKLLSAAVKGFGRLMVAQPVIADAKLQQGNPFMTVRGAKSAAGIEAAAARSFVPVYGRRHFSRVQKGRSQSAADLGAGRVVAKTPA